MSAVDEPFAGLFTQGMVTHESYRAADGRWLYPEEVERPPDGTARAPQTRRAGDGRPRRGDVQVQAQHRRSRRHHRPLRRRYGALVHPVRQPARARHGMDRGGRRRRLPLHPAPVPPGRGRRSRPAPRWPDSLAPAARALRRATHRTIAAVTEALEGFAFNVAVARLYEFANAIAEAGPRATTRPPGLAWARHEAVDMLARLVAPMMPHLAEEIHARVCPGARAWWPSWPGRKPTPL